MANKEKPSERAVRAWLEQDHGAEQIRRCAQDPPDYLVGNRRAVEVAELHQQLAGKSEKSTTEPMAATIRGVFADKKPIKSLGRLLVVFEYSPERVPAKRALQSELRNAIRPYLDGGSAEPERKYREPARHLSDTVAPLHLDLPCGVRLGFWRCSGAPEFVFGLHGGADTSILPVPELLKSATHAIERKTQRIEQIEQAGPQYSEWWLVLVDRIGLPPDSEHYSDLDELRRQLFVPAPWKRVVLLDMAGRAHELFPT